MSLHAKLDPAAAEKLRLDRRNATITSIIITLLTCVFIILILAFILLKGTFKQTPEIITFSPGPEAEDKVERPQITNAVERKPSAPSSSSSRVIASTSLSSVSIPVPEIETPDPSVEFGDGDDFGDGWGDGGDGNGAGSGGAGGFGSSEKLSGTLKGNLYDFKQNRRGEPVKGYSTGNMAHFADPVNDIQRSRFRESAFRKFFKAPQDLYARYIAIPRSPASNGPRYFQADKEVQPSGWLVHYSGTLKVPESGRYRLVGDGDDYISVSINGKLKLIAARPNLAPVVGAPDVNSREQPGNKGEFGSLAYGDWVSLKKGESIEVDIAIGERPGGDVGFYLLIEKKGEEYKPGPIDGKLLPPFVFGQLTKEDLDYLEKFNACPLELDKVPVFQAIDK